MENESPRGKPAPPSFAAFAARLLLYLFLTSLLFSVFQLHQHLRAVQEWMAATAVAGAQVLGASATLRGTVIQLSDVALDINHECTGVFVLLVYSVFVLAYPAPWMLRAAGLALGTTVLTAVNLGRLILLTFIASRRPELFEYFHEYFFQGVFIALMAYLGTMWTEQVRRAVVVRVSG